MILFEGHHDGARVRLVEEGPTLWLEIDSFDATSIVLTLEDADRLHQALGSRLARQEQPK